MKPNLRGRKLIWRTFHFDSWFRAIVFVVTVFLLAAMAPATRAQTLQIYSVTNLGGLGMTDARDINNQGQVVGNGGNHARLYSGGIMKDLGTLGGNWSEAYAINDSGQVVGASEFSPGYPYSHAFLYSGGSMTDLGTLPDGSYSRAFGINNGGQIVGVSSWPYGSVSFRYSSGTMSNFWPITLSHSAVDINSGGQMVLNVNAPYFEACYRYSGGVPTEVGRPGGLTGSSHGTAINNNGQVVGWFSTNSGDHAFVYNGILTDLGTLGGSWSHANAINNLGQIVGSSTTANGATHAFIYSGGAMKDINSTPDLAVSRLEWDTTPGALKFVYTNSMISDNANLTAVVAINDQGQILCSGGVLLTPMPPPPTCAQLFWANSAGIKVSETPIFTRTIATDFIGNSAPIQVPASSLQNPPINATHALLVLNCDNQFPEIDTNNNSRTLNLTQPDILPASMAWNATNGGLDFSYTVQPGIIARASTTVELFWANGASFANKISGAIFTQTIPANFAGQSPNITVSSSSFNNPPANATHVLLVVDAQNLVEESSENNNVLAAGLTLPDLFPNSFNRSGSDGGLDFSYMVRGGFVATAATTAKIFWASGPAASQILPGTPIFTANIPPGANGPSPIIHVAAVNLVSPPNGARWLLLTLDADNLVTEENEANNTLAFAYEDEPTELSGRVLDAVSRSPIEGASVNVGGRIATTSAAGEYVIGGVPTTVTNTLIVTKTGYATNRTTIIAPPNTQTKAVRDILLAPSGAFMIADIETLYDGLFISGVQFLNEFTAAVNWAGRTPGRVDFYVDGEKKASVTNGTDRAMATIDMQEFSASLGKANSIKVVAVDSEGASSPPREQPVSILPIPILFSLAKSPVHIEIKNGLPVIRFEIDVPSKEDSGGTPVKISRFPALENVWRSSASFEYEIMTGSWEFKAGTTTPKWIWGTWISQAGVEVAGKNVASLTGGLVVRKVDVTFSVDAEKEIWRAYVLDLVPSGYALRVLDGFSLVGLDVNSIQRIIISGQARVKAGLSYDFGTDKWDSSSVSERLGANAIYRPNLLGAELDLSTSLSAEVRFNFGEEKSWELKGEASFLLELSLWSTKSKVGPISLLSGVIKSSDFDSQTNLSRLVALSLDENFASMAPEPLSRNYLVSGPEIFVLKNAAEMSKDNFAGETDLSKFRCMSVPSHASTEPMSKKTESKLRSKSLADQAFAGFKQADVGLLQNIFPGAKPALAANGRDVMLLYATDSGISNSLQFTDINWMRWDGTNWGAPSAISTNLQGEFSPVVSYDGNGDAIALWERIADASFKETNLTAMAAQMEVVWSRWNKSDAKWSPPAAFTANSHLDHAPLLCGPMANGNVIALWTENVANLIVGTNGAGADKVVWCEWSASTRTWSTPAVLVDGLAYRLSQSLAGSANRAIYAWTRDLDGNLATDTDQEVFLMEYTNGAWVGARQFTTNNVGDKTVRAGVSTNGVAFLVWQSGSNLVLSRDLAPTSSLVRADSQSTGFSDFAMTVGPLGHLVLLWQDISTNGSDMHYSVYDPAAGIWSSDGLLCQDPPLEAAFAPAWDDLGNLVVAYDKVQMVATNATVTLTNGQTVTLTNILEAGRVDLAVTKRALIKDLELIDEDFKVEGINYLPGDQLTLNAVVRNVGNLGFSNVVVQFYMGNPATGGSLVAAGTSIGWLAGATNVVVSTHWIVPEPATNYTLYAVANPAGIAEEFNPSNNLASVKIGRTDLSVALLRKIVETNGALRITAQVQNLGAPTATNLILSIRYKETTNAPLATVVIPSLRPGRSAEFALQLPPGTQAPGESIYTLVVEELPPGSDVDTNNNQTSFAVMLWLDSDQDGMPDHWEIANHLNAHDASDATADPDRDGLSNLEEYRQGKDPIVFDNLRFLAGTLLPGNQFQFRANVEVGRNYELQASTNLVIWKTILTFSATNSPMVLMDTNAGNFLQRYYRLNNSPSQPPVVTQQPTSQTNVAGTTATFSARAIGTEPNYYQWRRSGIPLVNAGNISGVTDSTLTLTNVQTADAGDFDLVVSNAYGTTTSHLATLTVQHVIPAGLLAYYPFNGNAKDASGNGRDGIVAGATLTSNRLGHADSAYAVNGAQYIRVEGLDPDNYAQGFSFGGWVRVAVAGGSLVYWVADQGWGSSFILFEGLNAVHFRCGSGNPASDHSVPGISLSQDQWQNIFITHGASKDRLYVGGQLIGEWPAYPLSGNVSTLNIGGDGGAAVVDEIAVYGRELTASEVGNVYSATTLSAPQPPAITSSPASQTNLIGTVAAFAVSATGTAPLRYQWCRGGVYLTNNANTAGATSTNLILANVQLSDSGNYTVVVTNGYGAVTSMVAALTVMPPATNQITFATRTNGVFAFQVAGTPAVVWWVLRSSGLAGPWTTIGTITLAGNGAGQFTDTNPPSSRAFYRLIAKPPQAPVILQQPLSRTNQVGTVATFVLTASGDSPLGYQWRKNGANLLGATGDSLSLTNVQSAAAGSYDVILANNFGSVTSEVATLTVQTNNLLLGLLAYYPFNGNANDASGNGRHGIVEGATLTSNRLGQADTAYAVTGLQYIRVEGLDPDDYAQGFSFGGWVRVAAPGGSLVYWVEDGGWGSSFILFDGGYQFVHVRSGSGNPASDHEVSGLPLAQNQWQHIFITHGALKDRLYIGGQLQGEWAASPLSGNVSTLRIGWGGNWSAIVDDVAVYGRELTASEIEAVYGAAAIVP